MIKLACPHCRKVGMVPELLSEAGGWPIACHHCHQHYFAPVLSGPLPMARLIDLTCQTCDFVSQLESKALNDLRIQKFTVFCPKCHDPLPIQPSDVTTNLSPADAALELESKNISTDTGHSYTPQIPVKAQPKVAHHPSGNSGGIALFFVMGFFISIIVIAAARSGIIDRTWLDTILAALPQPSELKEFISSLSVKVAQLFR